MSPIPFRSTSPRNSEGEIRVAEPADLHRAFRATTGRRSLTFINGRRAMRIVETERACGAEMAKGVGGPPPVP